MNKDIEIAGFMETKKIIPVKKIDYSYSEYINSCVELNKAKKRAIKKKAKNTEDIKSLLVWGLILITLYVCTYVTKTFFI